MSRTFYLRSLLISALALVLTASGLTSATATDDTDIPYGKEGWFKTPGGVQYYSPEMVGNIESGRITVFFPEQRLAPGKLLKVVITDNVYGTQTKRVRGEDYVFNLPQFCAVPPTYRLTWDVPPGYAPQEVVVYFPDANGATYALRYEVNWRDLRPIATWKGDWRRNASGLVKELRYDRKVAQKHHKRYQAKHITRKIIKLKKKINRVRPYYRSCSGGPYTKP